MLVTASGNARRLSPSGAGDNMVMRECSLRRLALNRVAVEKVREWERLSGSDDRGGRFLLTSAKRQLPPWVFSLG
jgi:hypothetical protein